MRKGMENQRRISPATLVLDAIRDARDGISKKEIFSVVPISWGNLCGVVKELLAKGIIVAGESESVSRGRPSIPLHLVPEFMSICGVDVGSHSTRLIVCDLDFKIRFSRKFPTRPYRGREDFKSWLADLVSTAMRDSKLRNIRAIGISVSGNVNSAEGIIISGGNFGMPRGVNITVSELEELLHLPCFAVNTQAASVYAEYKFGKFAGTPNIINVGLGVGIGSGVVSDGELQLGNGGRIRIGNIGHMLMPYNPYRCRNTSCNFVGCLEAFSGGDSLQMIAKERFPKRTDLDTTEKIDAAAARGDSDAQVLLSGAAGYNATAIATMIQLYAPDALVFSGGQCKAEGFLYQETIASLQKIIPAERWNFKYGLSTLGEFQPSLGAARLAYEYFTSRW